MMPARPNPQRMEYVEYLQEKRRTLIAIRAAKIALAEAECDSDLVDMDEQIRQTERSPASPPRELTVEELTRATKAVQQLESQLESLDVMVREPGLGEALRPLIEGMMRPMLAGQLEHAESYRSRIQAELEEESNS